ncbi:MAG: signal peptidase I [Planctomycetota bacterium]|jgi:signal peptidase I
MNKERVKKFINRTWKEWRRTVFFIVFVLIPAKSSLADWNWVPTGSMKPTILEGDLVYVDKLAYGLRFPFTLLRLVEWSHPQRGDVVICFSPEDGTRLVKRVIGEPGDIVELRNNTLVLNGKSVDYERVDAKYIEGLGVKRRETSVFAMEEIDGQTHPVMGTPSVRAMRNFGPITVPEDHYFIMGDNRDNSKDSRFFGCVPEKAIVGKAKGVIVSFDITDKYQPRLRRFFGPLE